MSELLEKHVFPRVVLHDAFPFSEIFTNLYFVGAGTHPGAGMPGVLSSAKVLDRLF